MGIFHRYNSTIHGNYRKAYLISGSLIGALLALYVLVRLVSGTPIASPVSLVSDIILLVLVFLLSAYYRKSLPLSRITLKEAMLFGIGTAVVAGLVYGLLLWLLCLSSAEQTVLFTNTAMQSKITDTDPQLHYWAAMWSIVAGLEVALLGSFGAFIAAIVFRNEKSEIKHKKQ